MKVDKYMATLVKEFAAGKKSVSEEENDGTPISSTKLASAYELNLQVADDQDIINKMRAASTFKVEGSEDVLHEVEVAKGIENTDGDDLLAGLIITDKYMQITGWKKNNKESTNLLNHYLGALKTIKNSGESAAAVFKQYNIEFASIALAADNYQQNIKLTKQIAAGYITRADYNKASNFAEKLQGQAGVLIETDLGASIDRYTTGVSYSYNDALVKIGLQDLNFMADHEEAMGVWTTLARGGYDSYGDVVESLRSEGLDDVADAYVLHLKKNYRGEDMSDKDLAKRLNSSFKHSDGALWEMTCYSGQYGPIDTSSYTKLRDQLGIAGSERRYSASKLKDIAVNGQNMAQALWKAINDTAPRHMYQNSKGYWVDINS